MSGGGHKKAGGHAPAGHGGGHGAGAHGAAHGAGAHGGGHGGGHGAGAHGAAHGAGAHGGGHGAGGKKTGTSPKVVLFTAVALAFIGWYYLPVLSKAISQLGRSDSGGSTASRSAEPQPASAPVAPPNGSAEAKRVVEPEGSFSRMAREANALLDKVLPSEEGKSSEPPEGVISLRVGAAPVRRILRPGERSPWFKMTGSGRVRIQCDGPGRQKAEAWSDPAETSRIWRFYNYDGVGMFSFYLVQE